ncbi:hypothetical protein H1D32_18390 [Anaerobacillus sp. CMMVII]|uniref:hypothetical protein n=1 Tax=Anaerobacillus sp. CMMVII TaxID=2755588 RepID=UPI0021B7E35B|nr:hypothetical protein [Anaerobacillus sp. CMMVII]MCT8139500.1 hypothetical protein [Anaerobacillus sp. CMMVII]
MYGFIFGMLSLALLLFYGMIHTFFFVKKLKHEHENKKKYIRYGSMLGLYGCLSFIIAIILYYYGVG